MPFPGASRVQEVVLDGVLRNYEAEARRRPARPRGPRSGEDDLVHSAHRSMIAISSGRCGQVPQLVDERCPPRNAPAPSAPTAGPRPDAPVVQRPGHVQRQCHLDRHVEEVEEELDDQRAARPPGGGAGSASRRAFGRATRHGLRAGAERRSVATSRISAAGTRRRRARSRKVLVVAMVSRPARARLCRARTVVLARAFLDREPPGSLGGPLVTVRGLAVGEPEPAGEVARRSGREPPASASTSRAEGQRPQHAVGDEQRTRRHPHPAQPDGQRRGRWTARTARPQPARSRSPSARCRAVTASARAFLAVDPVADAAQQHQFTQVLPGGDRPGSGGWPSPVGQRSSWMRSRFPAGSRKEQSRTP